MLARIESALKSAGVQPTGVLLEATGLRARFADTDAQLKAFDLIEKALNPDHDNPSYVVALNLLSSSPGWLKTTCIKSRLFYETRTTWIECFIRN